MEEPPSQMKVPQLCHKFVKGVHEKATILYKRSSLLTIIEMNFLVLVLISEIPLKDVAIVFKISHLCTLYYIIYLNFESVDGFHY